MKSVVAGLLAAAISTSVFAEWVKIRDYDWSDTAKFVARESIRPAGKGKYSYLELTDYKKPGQSSHFQFRSSTSEYVIDCELGTQQSLRHRVYEQNMAQGKLLHQEMPTSEPRPYWSLDVKRVASELCKG